MISKPQIEALLSWVIQNIKINDSFVFIDMYNVYTDYECINT